ncbi:ABC transporter permease, partial [Nocardia elegans]|nr:ABC transporter permease [Nocardia elegans]
MRCSSRGGAGGEGCAPNPPWSPAPPRPWRRDASGTAHGGQSVLHARRLLLRVARDPQIVVATVVFPAGLLMVLNAVTGRQVSAFAGASALYGTVPMVALVAAMSGSVAGAVALGRERDAGLPARFWVLPVHRGADPLARLLAEAARILVATAVMVIVGVLLGFRFQQGVLAGV